MSLLDKWQEYIPSTRKAQPEARADAAATAGQEQAAEPLPETELRENLSLTAPPEGTRSFNRKNVLIGLSLVGVVFTGAFIYGISSASHTQKDKRESAQVEAAPTQAKHLQNAPVDYADEKTRRYERQQAKEERPARDTRKISRLNDDGSVEYEHYERERPARRSVPAYTPIPSYRPPVQAQPTPRATVPVQAPAHTQTHSGLTPEQKIAAEKAKEKMAANQSPISFQLEEEKP